MNNESEFTPLESTLPPLIQKKDSNKDIDSDLFEVQDDPEVYTDTHANHSFEQDISDDYNIPILQDVALHGDGDNPADIEDEVAIELPIQDQNQAYIDSSSQLNYEDPEPEQNTVSPEIIAELTEKLKLALIPEMENTAHEMLNHALNIAMSEASHYMRDKMSDQIDELLPALIEEAVNKKYRQPD